jgi:hypothetical protein
MPFDDRFVTYVWFDALINYVTAVRELGPERFELWPVAQHFIAKDILKPHAVYWPTMLMAAGLPLYDHLNVHGYWTVDGAKMSKSLGNVVRPLDMQAKYGRDAFRYVLLRESVFGLDADFREDALVTRINADLANNIGNLVSRTLSMQQKYFGGAVQPLGETRPEDRALAAAFAEASREVDTQVRELMLSRALEAILRAADHANKYIVETAPFTLAKDPATKPRVGAILHNCWRRCARRRSSPRRSSRDGEPHRRSARLARGRAAAARPGVGHRLPSGHTVQSRCRSSRASGLTPMGSDRRRRRRRDRPRPLDLAPPAASCRSSTRTATSIRTPSTHDRAAVIARARAAGVGRMITVGAGGPLASNHAAIALARADPDIFAAVAVHPHDASDDHRRHLGRAPAPVGASEGGRRRRDRARLLLRALAGRRAAAPPAALRPRGRTRGLPLVIHCRDAFPICCGSSRRRTRPRSAA